MHKLLVIFYFIGTFVGHTQQNWKEIWKIPLDSTAIWDIDILNQSIVFQNQTIQKRDPSGKLVLQESFKSIGNIKKIDAQNPLKIAFFSEDQQRICFLDNALALQNNCLNLNDLDVSMGTSMSNSMQTDRLWIYDEPNSRIELITLRNGQGQQVQNVSGLLNLKTIINIQEIDNRLFVFDEINQVAWFDLFGNLIDLAVLPVGYAVYPINKHFLVAAEKQISSFDYQEELFAPFFEGENRLDSSIKRIKVSGDRLYIQTLETLYCFQIH